MVQNFKKRKGLILAVALIAFSHFSGSAAAAKPKEKAKPRNVIVLIADGCGSEQYTLSRWFKGAPLALDEILVGGVKTHIADSVVADSAPTATAYATGYRTSDKLIGVGPKEGTLWGGDDFHADAEVVLVAAGAKPNVGLAASTGVKIGDFGAIRVTRRMETNIADIYAAGDCAETWNKLTEVYGYMPLGTTAHKQGRVAGENAAGGHHEYRGSLGTQVVKI